MCGLLGIGLPLQATMSSCKEEAISKAPEKVLIIGAGPAGLTAAYQLQQKGIEVQILEASNTYGGRMQRNSTFADFPIPLGAEWLHVERSIFDEIVNDSSIQVTTETTPYDPDEDYGLFQGERVSIEDIGFTIDQKFIDASWFDFFEQYVTPSIRENIIFNQAVTVIDYSQERVSVQTSDEQYTADKVILTAPVKMLQNNAIRFIPELPDSKIEAIQNVTVWDGCKAFIQFSEKFYPAFIGFDIQPETAGQKLYYDAAYGQNTDQHVMGLFAVGTGTLPYVQLSDTELINYILSELDEIFDGQASSNYINHLFQNWNAEPYANGAYVVDHENWRRVRTLGESVSDKLFFAGDAYTTGDDWGSVHAAARSAIRAVREMTG